MTVDVVVLGVRHHGPGSARSVRAALDELRPAAVVIEGAPELDALVPVVADPDLVPPVSALAYAVDEPRRAAFYPFATFSPEWVALRWAAAQGVPARFADLPAVHALAPRVAGPEEEDALLDTPVPTGPRIDPISALAGAAGYDDPERWWEDAVEHRTSSSLADFDALREAMAEVRAADPGSGSDPENLRREAAMRRVLRATTKDVEGAGGGAVAFVCGAMHAPAVHPDAWPAVARDARLLAKLPKTRVAVTWAPWSARRLATATGYGAGVTSPGWYHHLFTSRERPGATDDDVVAGWLSRVARVLREAGHDAPPASVVEAVRMAGALAAVRHRPSVGLSELDDAALTVLCGGAELPLRLVTERLVVGEEIGRVPDSVPLTPLARDVAAQQRRLRLKVSDVPAIVTLDLRRDGGRDRSVLLHRLALLDVPWAREVDAGEGLGTFKEAWELAWEPEVAVALVAAGLYGTTLEAAAQARVAELAREAADLARLGALVGACLVADLPGGLTAVVAALADRTAQQHDVRALLETVEPLARARRYGDVRGTDTGAVGEVLSTVVARGAVGLRAACAALDHDAAEAMRAAVEGAQRGIALLAGTPDGDALAGPWRAALATAAADDRVAPLVGGRVNRIVLDGGLIDRADASVRLSRRLSRGAEAPAGAAWLDGFLDGDAALLLHDPDLLTLLDAWVAEVAEETFEDLVPLLRRTFSRFAAPERRAVGERLRRPAGAAVRVDDVDWEAGHAVAARVAELLGLVAPEPVEEAS